MAEALEKWDEARSLSAAMRRAEWRKHWKNGMKHVDRLHNFY